MTELQDVLQEYQQSISEAIKKVNQLSPKPNALPESSLAALYYITSLLGNGNGGSDGSSGGAAITSTIWTDNSGAYYIRRETIDSNGNITANYVTPTGAIAIPGAGLRPLASTDRDLEVAYYDTSASGGGYSTGDLLARTLIIDANPSTPNITAIWINFSTGAIISAPQSADIQRADENTTVVGVGQPSDSPASSFNIAASLVSLVKAIGQLISDCLPSALAGDRLKVDVVFPNSQKINADTLPLPTNAATSDNIAEVRDRLMPSTGTTFTHVLANANSGFLKASPGNLYTLSCINMGSSKKYLQIFNKTTPPTVSDTPVRVFPVPASDANQDGYLFISQQEVGGGGIPLSVGISWGISTTATSFTSATASETILGFRWA